MSYLKYAFHVIPTASPYIRKPGRSCKGTDLNRNYGFHFDDGGSSDFECSNTYHGKSAFSEPENQNVRDFLMKNKDTVKFYNSIHSYSQLILLPWGYTHSSRPSNYRNMIALANQVITIITQRTIIITFVIAIIIDVILIKI